MQTVSHHALQQLVAKVGALPKMQNFRSRGESFFPPKQSYSAVAVGAQGDQTVACRVAMCNGKDGSLDLRGKVMRI